MLIGERKKIHRVLDDLTERYGELFNDELGTVQYYCVKLVLKQNAKPRFFRSRAVPYAIKDTIEKDLDRVEKLGVITTIYPRNNQVALKEKNRKQ